MPPEQAAAEHELVGPESDVYSLGASLYSALTGEIPFEGTTNMFGAVQFEAPTPPSSVNGKVPRHLDAIVLKCMAKGIDERYRSAEELLVALDEALRTLRGGVERPNSVWLALILAIGVAGVGLGIALGGTASPTVEPVAIPEPEAPPTEAPQAVPAPAPAPPPPPPVPATVVHTGGLEFEVLDGEGRELGRGTVRPESTPYPRADVERLSIRSWAIGEVDGQPGLEVVLLASQYGYMPTQCVVARPSGEVVRRYWHPGWATALLLHDVDGDGVSEILVGGTNNDVGLLPCVFSLDGRRMSGEAPPRRGQRKAGSERWFAILNDRKDEVCTLAVDGNLLVCTGREGAEYRVQLGDGPTVRRLARVTFPKDTVGERVPRGTTAADMNDDGRRDLIVTFSHETEPEGRLAIVLREESGFGPPWFPDPQPRGRAFRVAAADFDQDSRTDLAVLQQDEGVSIYLQQSARRFTVQAKGDGSGHDVVAIDLDRSPALVIAWGERGGVEVVRWSKDARSSSEWLSLPVDESIVRLAVHDWSGDGRDDLCGLTRLSQVVLWRQDSGALVEAGVSALDPRAQDADLIGAQLCVTRGLAALVSTNGQLGLTFLCSFDPESGVFQTPRMIDMARVGGGGGIGFLKGDRRATLLSVRKTGTLLVFDSESRQTVTLGAGADHLLVTDLDEEGNVDLVVSNAGDGTLSVLRSRP
jgi:hypothetical protein